MQAGRGGDWRRDGGGSGGKVVGERAGGVCGSVTLVGHRGGVGTDGNSCTLASRHGGDTVEKECAQEQRNRGDEVSLGGWW